MRGRSCRAPRIVAVGVLLALVGPARGGNPYPDLVWLCDQDIVRGRVLSDVEGEEVVVEIPDGAIWHLRRAKVCQVQHGINKDVWIPVAPRMRKERRTQLHLAAIFISILGGAALITGGAFLTPGSKPKYPYLPGYSPFPAPYREAAGFLIGGGLVLGIVAATVAGVAR